MARQAPTGKPPPSALARRHNVGRDAGVLIAEQVAGAADAGLDLVEDQQQAVLVAQLAQALEESVRQHAHAALAHHRLDHDGAGLRADRLLGRFQIGISHLIEAFDRRAEAFQVFLVAGGGDGRERAAVEGAFEGDDAVALRLAVRRLVFARHLDRAFDGFGAGVLEEHGVGEAQGAQPVGQPLAFRDAVEIGDVPELLRLLGERLDHVGMRMAEGVDRNAGGKVEIALARGRKKPSALAPLESEVDARIGRQ